jgi:hypothetical protein
VIYGLIRSIKQVRIPENRKAVGDTSEGQKSRLGKVQKLDGGLSFVEDAQQNALTIPYAVSSRHWLHSTNL